MDSCASSSCRATSTRCPRALQNSTPERMEAMKDMMAELNQMLEQREQGEEPDFDASWSGTASFPRNPQTSTSCSSRWRSRWRRCSSS